MEGEEEKRRSGMNRKIYNAGRAVSQELQKENS